jgi:hypothetical protein
MPTPLDPFERTPGQPVTFRREPSPRGTYVRTRLPGGVLAEPDPPDFSESLLVVIEQCRREHLARASRRRLRGGGRPAKAVRKRTDG